MAASERTASRTWHVVQVMEKIGFSTVRNAGRIADLLESRAGWQPTPRCEAKLSGPDGRPSGSREAFRRILLSYLIAASMSCR